MATRREKERRELRYNDAKSRAEKQTSGFGPSSIKIPKGFPLFAFKKEGKFRLRILPYSTSDRKIDRTFCDAGGILHYEYSYWTHRADETTHCCLKKTFHKACPVCDHLAKLDRYGSDKELYDSMKPKQRQLFALLDLDDREKGVQVFECSYYFGLGEEIDTMMTDHADKYGGFFHLQDGKVLEVSIKQGTFNGRANYKVHRVEMVEGKDLDEDILNTVPCLDELPIEESAKKLAEMIRGPSIEIPDAQDGDDGDLVEDEDDEEPVSSEKPIFTKGDKVRHKKYGPCTVEKIAATDGSLVLLDEDDEYHKGIDPDTVSRIEAEEDEDLEEEDDDDEEMIDDSTDDEDEKPAKKKK